jgi:hypothetical protein
MQIIGKNGELQFLYYSFMLALKVMVGILGVHAMVDLIEGGKE